MMCFRTSTQVLSCEICEIFRNIYIEEHLRSTASTRTLVRNEKYSHVVSNPAFSTLLILFFKTIRKKTSFCAKKAAANVYDHGL